MKNIKVVVKQVQGLARENAPALLSGAAIVGVAGTAYLSGRAAYKSVDIHNALLDEKAAAGESDLDGGVLLSKRELVGSCWKLYMPAVAVGSATVGCIFFSHRINSKRLAAMAAAYTLSDKMYTEYKDKVLEELGLEKESDIRKKVEEDKLDDAPDIVTDLLEGKILCKDGFSGRYFDSTMEEIKSAQNTMNYRLNHYGYVSLTDFYNELGLESTDVSDDLGWSGDRLLELGYVSAISPKNQPVLVMQFNVSPRANFWSAHE